MNHESANHHFEGTVLAKDIFSSRNVPWTGFFLSSSATKTWYFFVVILVWNGGSRSDAGKRRDGLVPQQFSNEDMVLFRCHSGVLKVAQQVSQKTDNNMWWLYCVIVPGVTINELLL